MMLPLSRLFRLRLALLNGVTAIGGYALYPGAIAARPLLSAFTAVTLLAMGGSAFNQLMERDIDALMDRTKCRPLPRGEISAAAAATAAVGTILAGLALLSTGNDPLPPLLGLLSLFWYLAVYTPLKRKTTLALPLGALCGAFPPLIGWALAGGSIADYRIVILSGLLFIWQIPHFWLLQERHTEDYRRAGIPIVDFRAMGSSRTSLFRIWLAALAATTLMLPALGCIEPGVLSWLLLSLLIAFIAVSFRSERLLFPAFSLFPLTLTALLIFFKLI